MKLRFVRFMESVRCGGNEEVASVSPGKANVDEIELGGGLVKLTGPRGVVLVPLGNVRYVELADEEQAEKGGKR
jgi:hypothetical protein